jgi:hypothetical protein
LGFHEKHYFSRNSAKVVENWQKTSKIGKKIGKSRRKSAKVVENRQKIAEASDHSIDPPVLERSVACIFLGCRILESERYHTISG